MSRRRRRENAQAVLETALVLPILLALVCFFVALMVQVQVEQEMQSAVTLAAESYFQSPRDAVDPPGTMCCGAHGASLDTSGMPKGCRFAAESFDGTMSARRYLDFGGGRPLCTRDGAVVGHATAAALTCEVDALDTTLDPPAGGRVVRCTARATLRLSQTPLGWVIVIDPTITATAESIPPPFRQ